MIILSVLLLIAIWMARYADGHLLHDGSLPIRIVSLVAEQAVLLTIIVLVLLGVALFLRRQWRFAILGLEILLGAVLAVIILGLAIQGNQGWETRVSPRPPDGAPANPR
jgi:cell division protein FtsW (lipid II flippase)